LPRTLISDLPGGFGNCSSRLNASGRCAAPPGSWRALPSLFGLAPCGVYLASGFTVGAVRSYRTISPLPRRWRFRNGERTRQARPTRVLRLQGGPPERGVAEAVSFLWHWPSMGFQTHVPDVIRHTALRSSDFPPPANRARARPPAATARSPCQRLVYPSTNLAESGRTSPVLLGTAMRRQARNGTPASRPLQKSPLPLADHYLSSAHNHLMGSFQTNTSSSVPEGM